MLPLVRRLARRYANRGEALDDLEQVGSVGLIKAIDRFDVSRELKLSTFAVPTVLGEIKRHFRDRVWSLRVPRDLQELNAKLSKHGRSPDAQARALADGRRARRRDRRLGRAGARRDAGRAGVLRGRRSTSRVGDGRQAADTLGSVDNEFEQAERRELLRHGLEGVADREREILHLRFYEGLTQREIADRVGISQMHVSRLIRRSLDQIRDVLDDGTGAA